ncbi:MAG TPA: peptidyl-alpha-hydroxyglycine alpha-amidating lyase family protein [Chloroflexota bacterium]|nr:peptidyl-alpha-hydroxyglycine alpha-amidating lyase family protein [Chloroflexota bacterium]
MAKRVGSGDYVYELDEAWGRLPDGWSYVDAVGVVVDGQDQVYVFNRGTHPVIVFDRAGTILGTWGEGVFANAHGLQIGPDGSIYCVDNGDHTVRKFTPDGKLLLTLGTPGQASDTGYSGDLDTLKPGAPFNRPTNCGIAADGSIYVSDGYGNCRVHRFGADGRLLQSWGEPGRGPGQFRLVYGVCIGSDGTVYVGDRANDRVQKFSPDGDYLGQWDDVRQPDDIHLGNDGRFFVAELGYQETRPLDEGFGARVTIRDSEGQVLGGWGDEGNPCEPGNCASPHGVAVDSQGDIYLGEVTYTSRVSRGLAPPSCHVFQKFVRVR